jgi:hypothetical protein
MILRNIPFVVIIDPAAKRLFTPFTESGFMFPSFNIMNYPHGNQISQERNSHTRLVHPLFISFTAFSSLVLVIVSVTS